LNNPIVHELRKCHPGTDRNLAPGELLDLLQFCQVVNIDQLGIAVIPFPKPNQDIGPPGQDPGLGIFRQQRDGFANRLNFIVCLDIKHRLPLNGKAVSGSSKQTVGAK